MASLQSLTDPQRAILQLLLKQGKSYDEIAALLKTDPSAVQARAHEAVSALGAEGPEIGADRSHEVADYLLGQQTASRRAATREYLEDSTDGRGWARTVAGALRPIAGDDLPEIPAEPAEVDQAFEALDRRTARRQEVQRSSQLGTKILFGGLGLAVAIGLILALGIFEGDDNGPTTATVSRTAATTPNETPQIIAQGEMKAPGSGSAQSAQTAIVRYPSNNQFKLLIAAKGLSAARKGTAYGVWLYTSKSDALFVGFPKATVSDKGVLDVVADLTPDTRNYREVLLTREEAERPRRPGRIMLRGELVVAAQPQASPTQTQTQPG